MSATEDAPFEPVADAYIRTMRGQCPLHGVEMVPLGVEPSAADHEGQRVLLYKVSCPCPGCAVTGFRVGGKGGPIVIQHFSNRPA